MTVNVRYIMTPEYVRSGFCINGVCHEDLAVADIGQNLRDVDEEPYHALHCLEIEGGDTMKLHSVLSCLFIQLTGLKRGQFRRFGAYDFWRHDYELSSLDDLKNARSEEWLEY
jgi:hypothetical protein